MQVIVEYGRFQNKMKYYLSMGPDYTSTWYMCYAMNISYQKLSRIVRKYHGQLEKRYFVDDYQNLKYATFNIKENAELAAEELNSIIIANVLGRK